MMKAERDDPQTYAIIGAAIAVHTEMRHGFLEAVYQESLEIEFGRRDIPFRREVDLPIRYCGVELNTRYRADFIVFEDIIVELKAQSQLTGNDQAQVINYLKATGHHRSLLLSFGTPKLEYKRLVF